MSQEGTPPPPQPIPADHSATDQASLTTIALCLVIAAASWYLMRELATLLRPLLLAVLLSYVILPAHLRLKQRMPSVAAIIVLAILSVGLLYLLAWMIYSSAMDLSEHLPGWIDRGQEALRQIRDTMAKEVPWLVGADGAIPEGPTQGLPQPGDVVNSVIKAATEVLSESIVVGFYLLFLLLEARRFPDRVRGGFADDRAAQILTVAGNISEAIASYLRVKVKASLVLAVPVTVVLLALRAPFPLMWGILTFIANFIPYLGSIFTCSLPILLAFLQMDFGWRPITVAVLLLAIHMASAYLIEPRMTGKAVGLSPLVILLSLAFWGLCWGLIGMVLAVPLTVMLKLVLENMAFTRPIARLMGE